VPDTPVVSVVVPCFNHGRFLRDALSSVGSPLTRTEIFVVDDGSTDSTPEVLATFQSSNEFRWVRQENAGLAAARNRGLQESRGKYVIFLDADDELAPGAVDLGASELEEHPECAFVFGRCRTMTEGGTLVDTPVQPRIVRDHYRDLLRRNYIWVSAAVMFRRYALERSGGFNSEVNAAADYELYLHLARHYPVHDHGEVVAHFRRHDASMSGDPARMLRETLAVMRFQRPFLEGDEASLSAYQDGWRTWQELYGDHLAREIRTALNESRWIEAILKTAALGRYHPRGLWNRATQHVPLNFMRDADARRALPATEISGAARRAPTTGHH
jgi:glycosyltransferase involved in cell wall biosynthesis